MRAEPARYLLFSKSKLQIGEPGHCLGTTRCAGGRAHPAAARTQGFGGRTVAAARRRICSGPSTSTSKLATMRGSSAKASRFT